MNIIVDAMGGDNAPHEIVKGSIQALNDFSDITLTFTGDETKIKEELAKYTFDSAKVSIVHTTQLIEMCDTAIKAIKEKSDSSMMVGLNLLAQDKNAIFISAGSTGALVSGATLIVKRIDGIKRPALAPIIPAKTGEVLLIDCGANVDCKPIYLYQFAIMGSIYMHKVYGKENPKIGLINNGLEESKGNELTKEAYKLLKNAPINFVGNAEGRELLSGAFDVIVCDGFTGNILLKFLEGSAKTILSMLKVFILESLSSKIGSVFMKGAFLKLKKKMDYKEHGGALLLGLNGGVVKAHGSSDSLAIYNSVANARKFLIGNVVEEIKKDVAEVTK